MREALPKFFPSGDIIHSAKNNQNDARRRITCCARIACVEANSADAFDVTYFGAQALCSFVIFKANYSFDTRNFSHS